MFNSYNFSSTPLSPLQQTQSPASQPNSANLASSTTPTSGTSAAGSSNESIEKDNIIANDIETDKLLNAIEKSKGFSDTNSTTRRVRNRNYPFGPYSLNNSNSDSLTNLNSENGDNQSINNINNNIKKINKLIWNEERQEVEYRDGQNGEADDSSTTNRSSISSPTLNADRQSLNVSPNIKRQNSGILDVNFLKVLLFYLYFL